MTNSLDNFAPSYSSSSTYAVDSLVTYNGKFYKCIFAVASPEQFDINKWDDVTTSEVYLRQANIDTRLRKVGMNDNSHFTFNDTNDFIVLESIANNGKVRSILFDVQNNVLLLRKSDDSVTFEDSLLYPTFRSGESKSYYGWATCQIIGDSSAAQIIYTFATPFLRASDTVTAVKFGTMEIIRPDANVWTNRYIVEDNDITDITCVTGDGNIAIVITTTQTNIISNVGKTVLGNYRFTLTKS